MSDSPLAERVRLARIASIEPGGDRTRAAAALADASRRIRRRAIVMINEAGLGHVGGDFSVIDILATLYLAVLRIDPRRPEYPDRDRLILSKGHASAALYATLAAAGVIDPSRLSGFMKPGSALSGHPDRNKVPGVEANTGPLGHGFPIAVGQAIAAKLDGSVRRVFVVVGDGELQEGSNWEAIMTGANRHLDNLVAVVDRNRLQQGASTANTNDLEPLADKMAAFGWHVKEANGHDHLALLDVFGAVPETPGRPTCLIAHTHKGYPVSFMEDNVVWHHRVPNVGEVEQALVELE